MPAITRDTQRRRDAKARLLKDKLLEYLAQSGTDRESFIRLARKKGVRVTVASYYRLKKGRRIDEEVMNALATKVFDYANYDSDVTALTKEALAFPFANGEPLPPLGVNPTPDGLVLRWGVEHLFFTPGQLLDWPKQRADKHVSERVKSLVYVRQWANVPSELDNPTEPFPTPFVYCARRQAEMLQTGKEYLALDQWAMFLRPGFCIIIADPEQPPQDTLSTEFARLMRAKRTPHDALKAIASMLAGKRILVEGKKTPADVNLRTLLAQAHITVVDRDRLAHEQTTSSTVVAIEHAHLSSVALAYLKEGLLNPKDFAVVGSASEFWSARSRAASHLRILLTDEDICAQDSQGQLTPTNKLFVTNQHRWSRAEYVIVTRKPDDRVEWQRLDVIARYFHEIGRELKRLTKEGSIIPGSDLVTWLSSQLRRYVPVAPSDEQLAEYVDDGMWLGVLESPKDAKFVPLDKLTIGPCPPRG